MIRVLCLFEDKRNLHILGLEGCDAGGVHIVFRDKHVEEAERHLELGGEFEVGAIEIEADADLGLDVVGVEFEYHVTVIRGFFLLGRDHVEGILPSGKHISPDVVQHSRGLVLEHDRQIKIDGFQIFGGDKFIARRITDGIVDVSVTEGESWDKPQVEIFAQAQIGDDAETEPTHGVGVHDHQRVVLGEVGFRGYTVIEQVVAQAEAKMEWPFVVFQQVRDTELCMSLNGNHEGQDGDRDCSFKFHKIRNQSGYNEFSGCLVFRGQFFYFPGEFRTISALSWAPLMGTTPTYSQTSPPARLEARQVSSTV